MIGSLRGTLVERSAAGEVVVEVGGVGYRVIAPVGAEVGPIGDEVRLHTHLHVREDALTLYGFPTRDERSTFEALIAAHGVGPALALAILSVHRPDGLREVVAADDLDGLCLVPGVGRKTAARLLMELKPRLDVAGDVASVLVAASEAGGADAGARGEVRAALGTLGYGSEEVRAALRGLPADGDAATLLRAALVQLGGAT